MSFALYLILISLSYVRLFELFAPDLAPYRPMLILMLVVLASSYVSARKYGGAIVNSQQARLIWGVVAMCYVSGVLAAGFSPALEAVLVFLPTPALFYLSALNLQTFGRVKVTAAVLVLSMLVLCGMSIACFHTGFMIDTLIMKENGSDAGEAVNVMASDVPALDTSGRYLWRIRSVGFLSDPNDFAQSIVSLVPIVMAFWVPGRLIRNLLVVGAPLATMIYTIYLTHSRGALLGMGALFFFNFRRWLGTVKTTILVVVLATGAMTFNFTGGRAYSANEESAGGRIDAWSEGLKMLSQYPITGVGLYRFAQHHTHTAHNTFVVCFGETGLLGYWIWLGLLIVVFKTIGRTEDLAPPGSEEQMWATRLKASLLGLLTCGIFLSRAFEPPLYIIYVLAIATWHSACQKTKGTPNGDALAAPQTWRASAFWFMLTSIFLVWVIVVFKTISIGRSV